MTRQIITATIHVEIDADDAEEAYENFCDGLDEIAGLVDVTVAHVEQKEKPYTCPPGCERWAGPAKEIRFDENYADRGYGRRLFGQYDGSWWWTNGHVMLRSDGAAPTDMDLWKEVPKDDFAKAVDPKSKRAPAKMGGIFPMKSGTLVRRSESEPIISISNAYHSLVAAVVSTWLVGKKDTVPIHGLDVEGRLVAVVMPMKLDAKDFPDPAPQATSEETKR